LNAISDQVNKGHIMRHSKCQGHTRTR